MDVHQLQTNAEKLLQNKADRNKIPLMGAIELLPLCNMNCKMCYVRQTKNEMDSQGNLLSYDRWLHIIDQAVDKGLLYLLLTGGEPLLYPQFEQLYKELTKKGLVLSVNTNGTLINETFADLFQKYGCRRLNITIYGKDNETYERLCQNPKGFSQLINACNLLKERNVPFRLTCSITPDNVSQLDELFKIANEYDVPFSPATYMFPASRRHLSQESQFRLTSEEAAEQLLHCHELSNPGCDMKLTAATELIKLTLPIARTKQGFSCHAGHSSFWINWKGEMFPCGMFEYPKIDLKEYSFQHCWEYIVNTTQTLSLCDTCNNCKKRNLCHVCEAACYNETGRIDGCPEYVCKMTDKKIHLLREYLKS